VGEGEGATSPDGSYAERGEEKSGGSTADSELTRKRQNLDLVKKKREASAADRACLKRDTVSGASRRLHSVIKKKHRNGHAGPERGIGYITARGQGKFRKKWAVIRCGSQGRKRRENEFAASQTGARKTITIPRRSVGEEI